MQKEKNRKSYICNTFVHRSSNAKRLKSKKDLENEEQKELVLPEWFKTK